jgi:type IV pilus assembly protein PilE
MNRSRVRGFSLIELVITLAIVAILATITVPSFNGLLAKSRRSDAISALLQIQLAQERRRADSFSYTADLAVLGWDPPESKQGYYRLHVDHAGTNGFLVTAQPTGVQQHDGCGVFAVDENGPAFHDSFADRDCWRR